jgi:tetratricopeptide (TPR) repeat protein
MKNMHVRSFVTLLFLAFVAPAMADQNDPQLKILFEKLKTAPDYESAHEVELYIWHIWSKADTVGGGVLLREGLQYMNNGEHDKALINFNALVEIEPEFAEGWNKRATLRYLMGNYNGSVADIQRTLALEQRHFGALSGLGLIYDALDQKKAALRAFRAALEIHPNMDSIRRRADDLAEETEGIPL